MKHLFLIGLAFSFQFSAFALANFISKKEFLQKFPLKEGHYDTLVDAAKPVSFCEVEELDILLHEDNQELTMTIGPKLVFAQLQKTENTTNEDKNCKVKTINTLATNSLKQVISETCGKKLNYFKTHEFKINGDTLEYSFTTDKKTEICKYKFLKEVSQK